MSRSQSVILFILIGAIVAAVIAARPAHPAAGEAVLPVGILGALQSTATGVSTQSGLPAPLPALTATMIPLATGNGPTPLSFSASELQTPLAESSAEASETATTAWNPPSIDTPLAVHPFDHYWLFRPVAANVNNQGHPHYAYGSDGPANDLRIHHGIDISNGIGVQVIAAADGVVVSSDKGHFNEDEAITAYGDTIAIQHDFGYNGQPVFTLYAHLSARLVEKGERVTAGQLIGLVGETGNATGSHVHFEVRVGRDAYDDVRNPDLWIIPYVGTGVIAGQVLFDNGEPAYDSTISLISIQTGEEVYRTTTYASSNIKSDDNWGETFTIPDVPAGKYLVRARHDAGTWMGEVTVLPGVTNWVEMTRTSRPARTPTPTP